MVDETINKEKYYLNNVEVTKKLIKSMEKNNIKNLIFSSTAAVYKPKNNKISENDKIKTISTYAKTKFKCEKLINNSNINSIILRFFNVCSSLIINKKIVGELHDPETHLIPTVVYKNLHKKKFICMVIIIIPLMARVLEYIHIKDICRAIEKSVKYLVKYRNNHKIFKYWFL